MPPSGGGLDVPVEKLGSPGKVPGTRRAQLPDVCVFSEMGIKEPAKFVHFAMTYSSRMSRENSKMMAGIADRTVSKYLHVLEEAMDEYMKQRVQAGDMLLGGDGKVVEIDEKELTINKNHKGRIPPKKITIFGMVEIDAPILRIEDVRLRTGVRKQEEKKEEKMRRKKCGGGETSVGKSLMRPPLSRPPFKWRWRMEMA